MAIKYELNYLDVANIEHYCNISDENYIGEPINISGRVTLDYGNVDDVLEPIRGQGLNIELDASINLNFNDLYSENERSFSVAYYIDSVLKFQGWLNVDGIYQNWVTDKWLYTFDCVDGLGYLKDLSFVNDNGQLIKNNSTLLKVISIALERTGIQQNINVDINIYYYGANLTKCTLENSYVNTSRFVKPDGDTIMNCEEVINSILQPFAAVLTSRNGEWWIYKPNQLFLNTTANFFRFNYLGIAITPEKQTYDFSRNIGSQLDGFELFHCNEDQQLNNKPSLGAFRIKYEYGFIKSLLDNTNLCADNLGIIEGWNIMSMINMESIIPNECGATWLNLSYATTANLQTDLFDVNETALKIHFGFETPRPYGRGSIYANYTITYIDDVTNDKYPLLADGSWGTIGTSVLLTTSITSDSTTSRTEGAAPYFDVISEVVPTTNGKISVTIWTPTQGASGGGSVILKEVRVNQYFEDTTDKEPKGETHTFQRTDKPSANIDNVLTIKVGDEPNDLYSGTIFKSNGEPSEFWQRIGFPTDEYSLLTIMGEEVMRMRQKPQKIFSGSVFGYVEYMSVIIIDGLDGLFMPIQYSYDSWNNITKLELTQIFGNEFGVGILKSVELPYYGNEETTTVQY